MKISGPIATERINKPLDPKLLRRRQFRRDIRIARIIRDKADDHFDPIIIKDAMNQMPIDLPARINLPRIHRTELARDKPIFLMPDIGADEPNPQAGHDENQSPNPPPFGQRILSP